MLWNLTPLKMQLKVHQTSTRYGNLSVPAGTFCTKQISLKKFQVKKNITIIISACLSIFELLALNVIWTLLYELSFYFALCQAVDGVCTMVEYSLDDPPKEDCSSLNYSTTVYYCTWLRNRVMNVELIIYYYNYSIFRPNHNLINSSSSISLFICMMITQFL